MKNPRLLAPDFLDLAGVAAYLGVSERYVKGIVFDVTAPHERPEPYRTLPGRKIGGKWRFYRPWIDEWARGTYRRPDAPPVTPIAVKYRAS